MSPTAASLMPKDYIDSGGAVPEDEDVVITAAEWVAHTFDAEKYDPSLFLCLNLEREGDDNSSVQYLSGGSLDYFKPMNGGTGIEALGSAVSLRASTKAARFLDSLVNSGFPEAKLGNDISSIISTKCHVASQPHKSPKKDDTVLLVENVITHPFMRGGKSTKKATPKQATPGGDQGATTTLVTKILTATKEGSISVGDLYQQIFEELKDDSETRTEVIATVSDNENQFLTDGPWKFDGETLSMQKAE